MRNGIKALVKHELKSTLYTGIYFMIIAIGVIYIGTSFYQEDFTRYMRTGANYTGSIQSIQIPMVTFKGLLLFFVIGIFGMSIMMFREQRHTEMGRFLKSLPCSEYHYGVKLVMGFLSYTIPYIIVVIAYIILRSQYIAFFRDLQSINYAGVALAGTDTLGSLLSLALLTFMILTAWYTFLMMVQYIWNHAVGAAIVGGLMWFAPLYIFISVVSIYDLDRWNFRFNSTFRYLQPFFYTIQERITPYYNDYYSYYTDSVSFIEYTGIKMIGLMLFIAMNLALTYWLHKKRQVENLNQLVPFKGFRVFFVIGVAVCSALALGMMSYALFRYTLDIGMVGYHLWMIAGGIVGSIVAYKVSHIGMERR
ncbi:MAG: hypothetical protein ACRDDX_02430 [Cellulosilyticaceae bacterium]